MRKEVGILLAIAVVDVVGGVVGASYYRGSVQKAPVAPDNSKVLVRPDSHTLGAADAKVTVVETLDLEFATLTQPSGTHLKQFSREFDCIVPSG